MKIFLIFSICISFFKTYSQNIFDSVSTEKYANYLFINQEYELAKEEFERLLFLKNDFSDTIYSNYIKSIRLSNNHSLAFSKMNSIGKNMIFESKLLSKEYLTLLIKNNKQNLLFDEIKKCKKIDTTEQIFYEVSAYLYQKNYKKGDEIIEQNIDNILILPYKPILLEQKKIRYKNPYLSSGMSIFIPGLGQTYSGNWKDGIMTFIFTASSAFQSYRGFHKYGSNSFYGWFFGAIASGFYLGNIYGAAKASNKYNYLKNIKISLQIEDIFDNHN